MTSAPQLQKIRGLLAFLGVVLHSSAFYGATSGNFKTDQPANPLPVLVHVIHSFRMEVFFLLSGLTLAYLHSRQTPSHLMRQRMSRLGTPLVLSLVFLIVPLIMLSEGRPGAYAIPRFALPVNENWFFHLWFLRDLLLFTFLSCWFAQWSNRKNIRPGDFLSQRVGGIGFWALVCVASLVVPALSKLFPWLRENLAIVGQPVALLQNGIFFCAGSLLAKHPKALLQLERINYPKTLLAVSLLCCAPFIVGTPFYPALHTLFILAGGYLSIVLGVAMSRRLPVVMKKLNEASYTTFIVHYPLLAMFFLATYDSPLPTLVKWAGAIFFTQISCLALDRWTDQFKNSAWRSFKNNSPLGVALNRPAVGSSKP